MTKLRLATLSPLASFRPFRFPVPFSSTFRMTPPRLTSPDLLSPPLRALRLTSPHRTSPHFAPPALRLPHLPSPRAAIFRLTRTLLSCLYSSPLATLAFSSLPLTHMASPHLTTLDLFLPYRASPYFAFTSPCIVYPGIAPPDLNSCRSPPSTYFPLRSHRLASPHHKPPRLTSPALAWPLIALMHPTSPDIRSPCSSHATSLPFPGLASSGCISPSVLGFKGVRKADLTTTRTWDFESSASTAPRSAYNDGADKMHAQVRKKLVGARRADAQK